MARQGNASYWAQRMKHMESALLDQSFSYVENMERQFAAAQAEIEKQIAAWYQRFAANNEITFADAKRLLNRDALAEFRWTVGEYIAHGQQNALDGAWVKQLENASARVHISRLEAIKLQIQQQAELLYANQLDFVDAAARRIYAGSYYGTAFELQRGLGVCWTMQGLNEGAITKILSRPWTADGQTFRDRCWTNKQALVHSVNTQLTQMIIRGEAPDRAIAAISKQFDVSKNKAGRLIMTESAYFSSAAQKDCYGELGVERYKIVASFDHDTCALCGALDGKVFKMSEYQVGLTAPPFHPWCRCCTAPYFEDMEGIGERWTRNADGTTQKVPANTTFEEWKKRFVQSSAPAKATGGRSTQIKTLAGVKCQVTKEQHVFSDGTGASKRAPVAATVYTTPDGNRFIFPDDMDPAKQTMTPEQAVAAWQKVPDSIKKLAQKDIEFVDYPNPQDSYWKKIYKIFSASYATGGSTITFYAYSAPHDMDYLVSTYCHEAGHYIDIQNAINGIRFSENSGWTKAMAHDMMVSGKASITAYGCNSPVEDFAESVAACAADPNGLQKTMPGRAALLKEIFGI